METVKCDLCGSEDYKLKYKIEVNENHMKYYRYAINIPQKDRMTGVQTIVECNNCELIYTNPRFSTEELNLVYSSDKVIGGNWKYFPYLFKKKEPDTFDSGLKKVSYSSSFYQWKFDIIKKYFKNNTEGVKLLDVGCGDGKFVHDAIERGFDAQGIDMSPDRVENGRKIYGLTEDQLKCMNVDEFTSDEKFDIIVMWDVLEHVESPSILLQNLKKISHKDTILLSLTMSIDSITYRLFKKDWNYINPTQHLHYFSNNTLKKMFEKNGFDLLGQEMDNTRSKNFIHLIVRIIVGQVNRFFFRIYVKEKFARIFFKPFQKGISNERMKKRVENLYPGKYVGRYHDNFVFVGKAKGGSSK